MKKIIQIPKDPQYSLPKLKKLQKINGKVHLGYQASFQEKGKFLGRKSELLLAQRKKRLENQPEE